jgi:hypothetical protein
MECFPISRKTGGFLAISGRLGIRGKRARLGGFQDYNCGSVIGDPVKDRRFSPLVFFHSLRTLRVSARKLS